MEACAVRRRRWILSGRKEGRRLRLLQQQRERVQVQVQVQVQEVEADPHHAPARSLGPLEPEVQEATAPPPLLPLVALQRLALRLAPLRRLAAAVPQCHRV